MKKKIIIYIFGILCIVILLAVLFAILQKGTIKQPNFNTSPENGKTIEQNTENLEHMDNNSDITQNTETIINDSENTENSSLNEEAEQEQRLYDDLDASKLFKIVIYYPGGTENVFTEEEDMNKFIAFLQSMHLSKGTPDDKDGSLFTAFLYYRDGSIEDIVLLGADLFAAGDELYKTDRDYGDDFKAMWKELKKD